MSEKNGKRALLIVDTTSQSIYGADGESVSGAAAVIPFIQGELAYFRERDRPVIFCVPPGQEVVEALHPRSHEEVIEHRAPNVFFDTPLAARLAEQGVKRVTLVGVGAAEAILLSAGEALAHGFGLTVPEPCVYDEDAGQKVFAMGLMFGRWGTHAEDNSDESPPAPGEG